MQSFVPPVPAGDMETRKRACEQLVSALQVYASVCGCVPAFTHLPSTHRELAV